MAKQRILAIDYGLKRTGLAITDENNIIASGLTTLDTRKLFSFLVNELPSLNVGTVVIGEPKRLNNEVAQWHAETEKFVGKLTKLLPHLKIERMDERFTSKMAFQTMIDSGLKKKDRRNKALIDEISATIILQSYMSANGI